MTIYETENFIVEAFQKPHVDRDEGGHIKIYPRIRYVDRQSLPPKIAQELSWLITVTGDAMTSVMRRQGVDIGRVNYQDNGNWSVFKPEGPYIHYHLYGRAKTATVQKYGDAVYLPQRKDAPEFYANMQPLTTEDCDLIKQEMLRLMETKYPKDHWIMS